MCWRIWIGGVFLLWGTAAPAVDNFVLGDWSGTVGLGYEGSRQETRGKATPDRNFDTDLFRETLSILNHGSYIFDPRLGTANLGLVFELFQEHDRFTDSAGNQDGSLAGYNFDTVILPEKPLNLLLLASQDQDIIHRDFGTRTDIKSRRYGAHFTLREDSLLYDKGIPYFRSSLDIERQKVQETSRGADQLFRRDEDRDLISLTSHKGFETADLDFRYTYENVTDSVRSDQAFKNQSASVNYNRDFGQQLNRRWDSRIAYFNRAGSNDNNSLIVNESFRLDHNDSLSTIYRYTLNRFDTTAGNNQNQSVSARVHKELYHQLFSNLRLLLQKDDIPSGTRDTYSTDLNSSYQRNLPHGGSLAVHLDGSAELKNNDLDSSLVGVVDEVHRAPDDLGAGNGFFLRNPFALPDSIEVVDVRGGSRLPTVPGVDYEIFREGDRVQIIPAAAGVVIQPGDPLRVSYVFSVAPAIRFTTGSWSAGGRIDYGWIAFSAGRDKSAQHLLAGRDTGFLNDRLTDTLELTLRGNWKRFTATSNFGFEREDSTRLMFRRWKFRQFMALAGFPGWRLSLSAHQAFTDFRLPIDRRRENYSARLSLDGYLLRTWAVSAFAGTRLLNDSEIANESIREAGLDIRNRFGKLSISGGVSWSRFERGDVATIDWRFQAHVARRF